MGDAFHYKDPLDGQGIYDALLASKMLAEAIQQWQSGGKRWQQASEQYAANIREVIRPMLMHTVQNIKQTMYSDPPPFIIKTLVRWLTNSPDFQRDYVLLLNRAADPGKFPSPGLIPRAIMQGIANDLFRRKRVD